jgi:membrane-bound ClpP family serine protease
MEERVMKYRKSLIVLAVLCLILAVLGFLGLFIHGSFEQFINGATPGVLAGLSALMLIFLGKED